MVQRKIYSLKKTHDGVVCSYQTSPGLILNNWSDPLGLGDVCILEGFCDFISRREKSRASPYYCSSFAINPFCHPCLAIIFQFGPAHGVGCFRVGTGGGSCERLNRGDSQVFCFEGYLPIKRNASRYFLNFTPPCLKFPYEGLEKPLHQCLFMA